MGLTIHWDLDTETRSRRTIESRMLQVWTVAHNLPLDKVGDMEQKLPIWCGRDYDNQSSEWATIRCATKSAGYRDRWDTTFNIDVKPLEMFWLTLEPGGGCESMCIAINKYPGLVQKPGHALGKKCRTGFAGWNGGGYCKTIYASGPQYGGVMNFLKCHLSVCCMLESLQGNQLLSRESDAVYDEGEFWENRDLQELAHQADRHFTITDDVYDALRQLFVDAGSGFRYFDALRCRPSTAISVPVTVPDISERKHRNVKLR
jgi:hypothetical protein